MLDKLNFVKMNRQARMRERNSELSSRLIHSQTLQRSREPVALQKWWDLQLPSPSSIGYTGNCYMRTYGKPFVRSQYWNRSKESQGLFNKSFPPTIPFCLPSIHPKPEGNTCIYDASLEPSASNQYVSEQ